MTSEYSSFFVESTSSSSSNAYIASIELIRKDQDDELILWSKNDDEDKNDLNKA